MNIEDLDIAHAEHEADPKRWQQYGGSRGLEREYSQAHHANRPRPDASPPNDPWPGMQREEVEAAPRAEEEEERPQAHSAHDGRHMSIASTGSSSSSSFSSVAQESIRPNGQRQRTHHLDSTLTQTSTQVEEKLFAYLDRHPTAIQRVQDHRLQHIGTVGSRKSGPLDTAQLPNFGGKKPYPPPLPAQEEYVVEFDGHDDPLHAQNWPLRKKLVISAILMFFALAATFASSIFSAAMTNVEEHFGKSREVVTLGTSLFVLGYAVGPIVFAPLSELYGRRIPIIFGAVAFGIFNIEVAVAKDFQTLIIGRFFSGFFGSAPLTICAAVFADMYSNEVRGVAVAMFSATIFCGAFHRS